MVVSDVIDLINDALIFFGVTKLIQLLGSYGKALGALADIGGIVYLAERILDMIGKLGTFKTFVAAQDLTVYMTDPLKDHPAAGTLPQAALHDVN